MASKKRGGLSKREYAAQQKSLTASKAKTSSRSTAAKAKTVAPLVGAGPLMTGQTRVGSTVTGAGPLLQGQTRDNSYTGTNKVKSSSSTSSSSKSSNRKAASKAAKQNAYDLTGGADSSLGGELFADTGNALGRAIRGKVNRIGSGWAAVGKGLGDMVHTPDFGISEKLGVNKFMDYFKTPVANAAEGDLSALGEYLQSSSEPDIPTGAGDNGELFFNNNTRSGITRNSIVNPDTGRVRGTSSSDAFALPTFINTARAETTNQSRDTRADSDPSIYDESVDTMNALRQRQEEERQLNNARYSGGQLLDQPGVTSGNRSGRGSGLFATGKGYQGNPLLDEYNAQLKGFKSQGNKMEKLYDEMIKTLDPTYDAYSADIKKSVDEELRQNLLKLSSTMAANNTLDSEQRAQLMSQQQGQSEASLGDLLRKLMLQKQEDISGIKEKKAGALERLQGQQMSTREKLAQLMADMQNRQATGTRGSGGRASASTDGGRDMEFEKSAKQLVQQVLMGRMNRDAAARNLASFFPDYDENVIYDLLPDNYNQ